MKTIGILGAGHIGSQVAIAMVGIGYDVIVSNSRGPDSLKDLVSDIGPKAKAATSEETAKEADIVVVSVPLGAFKDIPVEPLVGKIVINTTNYNAERDGPNEEIDSGKVSVSELLQRKLPLSHVVKAFSHLSAADVTRDGKSEGSPNRRALALAGDDDTAKKTVADIYNLIGFDAVDIGRLSESWRIGMGQPAFVVRQNIEELKENVAKAKRSHTIV
jgi:predicted dinucleotide-binding enzyme